LHCSVGGMVASRFETSASTVYALRHGQRHRSSAPAVLYLEQRFICLLGVLNCATPTMNNRRQALRAGESTVAFFRTAYNVWLMLILVWPYLQCTTTPQQQRHFTSHADLLNCLFRRTMPDSDAGTSCGGICSEEWCGSVQDQQPSSTSSAMDAYQSGAHSMTEHDVHAAFRLQTTSSIPFQMWALSMVFRDADPIKLIHSPFSAARRIPYMWDWL
jgi:hypothetical protein